MKIVNPDLCIKCKGRLWCGLNYCPILLKKKTLLRVKPFGRKDFEGFEYGVFVGWKGYPNVSLGFFFSERFLPEDPKEYMRLDIRKVAEYRISMILGKERRNVRESFGLEGAFVYLDFRARTQKDITAKKIPDDWNKDIE